MPGVGWDEALRRWSSAGLLSAAQADAIRAFEAAQGAPAAAAARSPRERFTATEALVYAGAATILAGLAYLVASSTPTGVQAAVSLAAGGAGIAAGWALAAGQAPSDLVGSGRRAAGVCIAAAAGLAGAGASLLAIAAGWLVVSTTICFAGAPDAVQERCFTNTDRGADAIVGAAVALVIGTVAFDRLRGGVLVVLAAAAAYTTAFTAVGRTDSPGPAMYAAAAVAAGGFLAGLALRAREAREPMLLAALVVPMTALFLTDGSSSVGPGGVLAGLAAAAALTLAVPADSNGLAVAGGLGIFGFCVDVTVRSLGSTSPALVLIVGGLALVGCAVLVQRAVRRNRGRAAGAPATPALPGAG